MFVIASLCGAALVLIPLLPERVLDVYFFAYYHCQDVPLSVRILLALLGVAVTHGSVNQLLWTLANRLATATRRGWSRRSLSMLLVPGSFLLFWVFRQDNFSLGDSAFIRVFFPGSVHLRGFLFTFDEPLELIIHTVTYRLLFPATGLSIEQVYALYSCAAGVVFISVTRRLWRLLTGDTGMRSLAVWLSLSSGVIQLFFGYVEDYTLVTTGMWIYLLLAQESLEGRRHPAWASFSLSLSFCLHILAGWLFPSLLFLWLGRTRRKLSEAPLGELGQILLALLLPMALCLALLLLAGVELAEIKQAHVWRLPFIFLKDHITNPAHPMDWYPMLSFRHLSAVLNQAVLVALPGVLSLLVVAFQARPATRNHWGLLHFSISVAVLFQLFALTYYPGLGPRRDWDLFSCIGLGYGLLGTYLLLTRVPRELARYAGVVILTLSLIQTGLFVLQNSAHAFR